MTAKARIAAKARVAAARVTMAARERTVAKEKAAVKAPNEEPNAGLTALCNGGQPGTD
jgi:hypothetical protein